MKVPVWAWIVSVFLLCGFALTLAMLIKQPDNSIKAAQMQSLVLQLSDAQETSRVTTGEYQSSLSALVKFVPKTQRTATRKLIDDYQIKVSSELEGYHIEVKKSRRAEPVFALAKNGFDHRATCKGGAAWNCVEGEWR